MFNKEAAKARQAPPELRQIEATVYAVSSSCGTHTWHEVSTQTWTCTCTTFSKMGLPCRHILAVCERTSVMPDLSKVVKPRWFKSHHLRIMAADADAEETCDTASHQSTNVELLTMPGPAFIKMNRNELFNYAMRTPKSVADHLADCSPDVFRAKLAVIENLYADWLTESSSGCVSSAVEQLGAGHHDTPCGSVDVQINESDLEEQLHDTRKDGIEEKRTSPVQVQDKPEENIATHEAYCSVNIQAASSCSNPGTPQLKLPLVKPREISPSVSLCRRAKGKGNRLKWPQHLLCR